MAVLGKLLLGISLTGMYWLKYPDLYIISMAR